MWIDSHCHLDCLQGDLEPYLERAAAAGVEQMLTIGTDLPSSRRAVDLAARYPQVRAVVGIHPTEAQTFTDRIARAIEDLAGAGEVVAVGEVGLDYHWDRATPRAQEAALRAQIDIARRVGKPLVLHVREAMDQVLALLTQVAAPAGTVFHCFSGNPAQAAAALALGGYISFAGNLSYKSAGTLRESARGVPLDRLLVETDSPYLAPVPFRGKSNEPAWVAHVGAALAAALDRPEQEIARATSRNAARIFRLNDQASGFSSNPKEQELMQ